MCKEYEEGYSLNYCDYDCDLCLERYGSCYQQVYINDKRGTEEEQKKYIVDCRSCYFYDTCDLYT